MPETSIIIRTFNEQANIGNLLLTIKEQDYQDYEIIIVDSGSTDNTLKIAEDFDVDKILEIENYDFTFGYSLNVGCKKARGKYLVFVSAHVAPQNNQWLGNLLSPFHDEKVAVVYGKQIGGEHAKFCEKKDFERLFGAACGYPNNANAAIRRALWKQRPFDEYLFGLEDMDWAKHMKAQGFTAHYESKAAVLHIHNEKWAQIFNRYRREAIAAAGIGLPNPPQAKPGFVWLASTVSKDILTSLPDISPSRLEEIARFRYYQWKGTRQGWLKDRHLDINRDKYTLFYPSANKAVLIKAKHRAALEQLPLPEAKPGDILVKVEYAGVCRTDLEVYEGSLGYYKKGLAKYPIVPGHEFSGAIVQIGANSRCRERFKIGDKVVGECILSRDDGSKRKEVGVINCNGAYGQFIVMPGQYLHKIPAGLDLKTACLTEPLAVVLRALRRLAPHLGAKSEAAVIGAGPIGNFCSQVLTKAGHKVTVFDKNKERLRLLSADTSQTLDNLKKFNVIVEATGSREVLDRILKTSPSGASILLLGFPYGSMNYNFENIVGQERVIIGSVGGESGDFKEALQLLPKLDTAPFVQNILPLNDFAKAWELQRSSKHLKIILKP